MMKIGYVTLGLLLSTAGITGATLFNPGSMIANYDDLVWKAILSKYDNSALGQYIVFYAGSVGLAIFGLMMIYYGMNVEDRP